MSEEAPAEPVVYDVIVDFGNGTVVKIENGLSLAAARIARKRVSKFFQGVQVVERSSLSKPRDCHPDLASE
jgi:hypothetical protein